MPSVDVAMARSLRGGIWGSLTEALGATLGRRDTISDVQDKAGKAVNAFSSWDSCMKEAYCKWPVIAIIVIGGLIILSIVIGIIRCACCGLSCCCQCCSCLKCCGQCCGLCDPPKGKPHRYLDNETIPPNAGYRAEPPMKAPMLSPGPLSHGPRTGAAIGGGHHAAPEPPQYAEFDVSRKVGEDALPAMPSWQDAASKKVLVEDEHEMEALKKPEAAAAAAGGVATVGALAAGHSSHNSPAVSPGRSPYGQPSPAGSNGYFSPGQQPQQSPYGAGNEGYNNHGNNSLGVDQYGAVSAAGMGPGRHSPQQRDYNNGYGQQDGYGSRSHSPHVYGGQGAYGQQQQGQGYSQRRPSPPRSNTYGSEGQMRRSPAPHGDYGYDKQPQYGQDQGYGYNQQQQQYSSNLQYNSRQQQPHGTEEYDAGLQNNSGFDFNSGYSRPQQLGSPGGGSANYGRRPSPPRQQQQDPGYQAYRPYQGGGY